MANTKNASNPNGVQPESPEAKIARLEAEMAALSARNETLEAKAAAKLQLTLKIAAIREPGKFNAADKGSDGGAVSLYGLQRMPISLYPEQWERLANFMPEVLTFLNAHPELPRRNPSPAQAAAFQAAVKAGIFNAGAAPK